MARKTSPYITRPLHPNFLKRRIGHDYCRPARYLLTLMKAPEIGILSEVIGSPYVRCPDADAPATKLTEEGAVVERAFCAMIRCPRRFVRKRWYLSSARAITTG